MTTRRQRELAEAERQMLTKWANMPKFARTPRPVIVEAYKPPAPHIRPIEPRNSVSTVGGSTALKPKQQYTGDKVKGVATMHKSNAVPVFSEQEAIEVARMRRG